MQRTVYEEAVRTIISLIGEDPDREGLKDTPNRVVRSHKEMFSGYKYDEAAIKKLLTTFDAEGYNEIILVKNIEFYSTCEHHLLPFLGKAHIAYIPSENEEGKAKIVGLSKLPRLLEVFSRRLQVQERICEQVVQALETHLYPTTGCACILECKHLCMACRGVKRQNAVMVTSSLRGVFLDPQTNARQELLSLIKD